MIGYDGNAAVKVVIGFMAALIAFGVAVTVLVGQIAAPELPALMALGVASNYLNK